MLYCIIIHQLDIMRDDKKHIKLLKRERSKGVNKKGLPLDKNERIIPFSKFELDADVGNFSNIEITVSRANQEPQVISNIFGTSECKTL